METGNRVGFYSYNYNSTASEYDWRMNMTKTLHNVQDMYNTLEEDFDPMHEFLVNHNSFPDVPNACTKDQGLDEDFWKIRWGTYIWCDDPHGPN
jgi:hypothetical protein